MIGFAPATVQVTGPVLDATAVPFGGDLVFTATITNTSNEPATLMVD